MKYKFIYSLGNTINNRIEIEADNVNEAYMIFYRQIGNSAIVTGVEQE